MHLLEINELLVRVANYLKTPKCPLIFNFKIEVAADLRTAPRVILDDQWPLGRRCGAKPCTANRQRPRPFVVRQVLECISFFLQPDCPRK